MSWGCDAVKRWFKHVEFKVVGGGSLVSIVSGGISLALVGLIRWWAGSEEASLYLFASALATLVGAALSMGIPEYGQVLGSGRKKGVLSIPLGLCIAVLLILVYVWKPGGREAYSYALDSVFFLSVLAGTGVILICSELRFRYQLLHSTSMQNFAIQNVVPIVLCIVLYVAMGDSMGRNIVGAVALLVLLGGSLYFIRSLPMEHRITLLHMDHSQFSFYSQRLLFVFIDTSLLVSMHGVMTGHNYVLMGVLTRVLTPIFIVLNVYVARRQAKALMEGHTHTRQWWHLCVGFAFVLIGILGRKLAGSDSAWCILIAVVLVRYWVIALVAEFQQWLPESPMRITLASFAVWGAGVYLMAHRSAALIDIILALVMINLILVVLMILKDKSAMTKF